MTGDAIRTTLGALPFHPPDPLLLSAWQAYQHPPRAYHTFAHAADVVRETARFGSEAPGGSCWSHPVEVSLAALFHDAVYVPGRADNEARSAALAAEAVERWVPEADRARVVRLVLLTARHGEVGPDDVDDEEALFLDCDTAILGAEPDAYDRYERGVAVEYAPLVSPEGWRMGRAAFLSGLLAKPRIFLSDAQHQRLESRARANLTRALAALG